MTPRPAYSTTILLFLCIGTILFCPALHAETEKSIEKPYFKVLRSLEINRSLLTKAKTEYLKLSAEEETSPSGEIASQLEKLRYKIKALEDDAARLQSDMPKPMGAQEFLKDLVVQREKGSRSAPIINHEQERKIDAQLQDVYRLHERALELVQQKQLSKAAHVYEEIILISPDDDEAYLLLGHTYLMDTKYQKAAQAFRNAISIDPANASEITPFYQNIVIENPEDDIAYCNLGYAWMLLGNAEESQKSFMESLRINPGNRESRAGMSELASYTVRVQS